MGKRQKTDDSVVEREALEWLVCIPWLGGREERRCPVCNVAILTPDDIKQCLFAREPDIVHKTCWSAYEATLSEMTTTEAAQYLTEHGYTVRSKRDGTDKPPAAELVKRWCEQKKVKARKTNWVWLIERAELDRLISARHNQ
jgi:hypothetical protein